MKEEHLTGGELAPAAIGLFKLQPGPLGELAVHVQPTPAIDTSVSPDGSSSCTKAPRIRCH